MVQVLRLSNEPLRKYFRVAGKVWSMHPENGVIDLDDRVSLEVKEARVR